VSANNDAAFLRMFLIVLGALVAFTVVILFLANRITGVVDEERGEDPRMRAAVIERIRPVGSVNVAAAAAAGPAELKSGADIVASACNSCHVAGVLGAPKVGDKDAWSQRLAAAGGLDGLTASAIAGKGGMPPKGGANVSDAEIRSAVEHLLSESGVDAAGGGDAAPAESGTGPVDAAKDMASDAADAAQAMASSAAATVTGAVAAVTSAADDEPAFDLAKGKSVYDVACFACHMTGAAGAPKMGDSAVWGPRIALGMDTLVNNAINGKNAMPPKGGRVDLSDQDVASAVAYLVEQSK
jgi:cytochrome c5